MSEVFQGRVFVRPRQQSEEILAIGSQGAQWRVFSRGEFGERRGTVYRFNARSADPGITCLADAKERIEVWKGMGFKEIRASPDAAPDTWGFTIVERLPNGARIIAPFPDARDTRPSVRTTRSAASMAVCIVQATDVQMKAIGILPLYL